MIRESVHCSPGSFIQGFIASIETHLNKRVMIQICKSEQDIEEGKVRSAREFLEEL